MAVKSSLSNIVTEIQAILTKPQNPKQIIEKYQSEKNVSTQLRLLRNQMEPISLDDAGILFERNSEPIVNEQKFETIWTEIFELNEQNVPIDKLSRYDDIIDTLIEAQHTSPYWWELTEEDLRRPALPVFRVCDYRYYTERMNSFLNGELRDKQSNASKNLKSSFQRNEHAGSIDLVDDLAEGGIVQVLKSWYIKSRVDNECDPHYHMHPLEMYTVTIAMVKSLKIDYFNYGLRFIQRYMAKLNNGRYHMPVEFQSDGKFVTIQYDSLIPFQLRYVLNLMSSHINYFSVHEFSEEYMDMSNEILFYILKDVQVRGNELKKMLTMINQYYGLSILNVDDSLGMHCHPVYPQFNICKDEPPQRLNFTHSDTCYGCHPSTAAKACYSHAIRKTVKDALDELKKSDLNLLVEYLQRRIIPRRACREIIYDLIFIRYHVSAGGYSHTHQLAEFSHQLASSVERNEKFVKDKDKLLKSRWLQQAMFDVGYGNTHRLLQEGLYPNGKYFRSHLISYTTSRSSGISPFTMTANFNGKPIRARYTSKIADMMLRGRNALALNVVSIKRYLTLDDYLKTLTSEERTVLCKRLSDGEVTSAELYSLLGASKIGTRSTTNFRPTRAIFINPAPAHYAQAAIIGPHVTNSNRRINYKPRSIFPNSYDLGASISTQFMDGSTDFVSPAVQSASAPNLITVCADCSGWDQNFLYVFFIAYYKGIASALKEQGDIVQNECYMYFNEKGLNLNEIIEWFEDFRRDPVYIAEYLKERRSYHAAFQTSGGLDTFCLNSIENLKISERIASLLSDFVNCTVEYVQAAGDDIYMLVRVPPSIKAVDVDKIKDYVVEVYTQVNQKINKDKSVVSVESGEFAKIYWYLGMVFRDPVIQFFESEKNSNSDNLIETMRGDSQKRFEASRRAICDIQIPALYNRLLLGLSYNFKIKLGNRENQKIYKFYPNYDAIITPTAYKGGLGASYTGVLQNEVIFIHNHLSEIVSKSLAYTDTISLEHEEIIVDEIFKNIAGKDKFQIISSKRENTKNVLKDINFTSDDPSFHVGHDLSNGLNMQRQFIDKSKSDASKAAAMKMLANGKLPPVKLLLDNQPYVRFYDAIKTISRDRVLAQQAIERNIQKFYRITSSGIVPIKLKKSSYVNDVFDKYKLYKAAFYTLQVSTDRKLEFKNSSSRYVSAPLQSQMLEQEYGSRNEAQYQANIRGSSIAMQRFISATGIPIVEDQLHDEMINRGLFFSNNTDEDLFDFLVAISGNNVESRTLVNEISKNMITWHSESLSSSINNTILENIQFDANLISKLSMKNFSNSEVSPKFTDMLVYFGVLYALSYQVHTGSMVTKVNVSETRHALKIFNNLRFPAKGNMEIKDDYNSNGIRKHFDLIADIVEKYNLKADFLVDDSTLQE